MNAAKQTIEKMRFITLLLFYCLMRSASISLTNKRNFKHIFYKKSVLTIY